MDWKLEQKYETLGPRTLTKRNKRARKESNRLPIKTPTGSIVHVAPALEFDTDSGSDADAQDEASEEAPAAEGAQEEEAAQPEQPKVPERRRVVEAKEELAKIATAVQEDPEENVRPSRLTVRGACELTAGGVCGGRFPC